MLQRSVSPHPPASALHGTPAAIQAGRARKHVRPQSCPPVCASSAQDVRGLLRESLATPPADPIDSNYRTAADYMRHYGFTDQEDLRRILDIAMNPMSLHRSFRARKRSGVSVARLLSVEQDIQPVLQFLASKGLAPKTIVKVVSAHPPVLCYSPEGRLKPFFDALAQAGIADPVRAVVQRPTLLGLEPDQGLKRIVGYLRENGHSAESIAELLATTI